MNSRWNGFILRFNLLDKYHEYLTVNDDDDDGDDDDDDDDDDKT